MKGDLDRLGSLFTDYENIYKKFASRQFIDNLVKACDSKGVSPPILSLLKRGDFLDKKSEGEDLVPFFEFSVRNAIGMCQFTVGISGKANLNEVADDEIAKAIFFNCPDGKRRDILWLQDEFKGRVSNNVYYRMIVCCQAEILKRAIFEARPLLKQNEDPARGASREKVAISKVLGEFGSSVIPFSLASWAERKKLSDKEMQDLISLEGDAFGSAEKILVNRSVFLHLVVGEYLANAMKYLRLPSEGSAPRRIIIVANIVKDNRDKEKYPFGYLSLEVKDDSVYKVTEGESKILFEHDKRLEKTVDFADGSGLGLVSIKHYVNSWGGEAYFRFDPAYHGNIFGVKIPLMGKSLGNGKPASKGRRWTKKRVRRELQRIFRTGKDSRGRFYDLSDTMLKVFYWRKIYGSLFWAVKRFYSIRGSSEGIRNILMRALDDANVGCFLFAPVVGRKKPVKSKKCVSLALDKSIFIPPQIALLEGYFGTEGGKREITQEETSRYLEGLFASGVLDDEEKEALLARFVSEKKLDDIKSSLNAAYEGLVHKITYRGSVLYLINRALSKARLYFLNEAIKAERRSDKTRPVRYIASNRPISDLDINPAKKSQVLASLKGSGLRTIGKLTALTLAELISISGVNSAHALIVALANSGWFLKDAGVKKPTRERTPESSWLGYEENEETGQAIDGKALGSSLEEGKDPGNVPRGVALEIVRGGLNIGETNWRYRSSRVRHDLQPFFAVGYNLVPHLEKHFSGSQSAPWIGRINVIIGQLRIALTNYESVPELENGIEILKNTRSFCRAWEKSLPELHSVVDEVMDAVIEEMKRIVAGEDDKTEGLKEKLKDDITLEQEVEDFEKEIKGAQGLFKVAGDYLDEVIKRAEKGEDLSKNLPDIPRPHDGPWWEAVNCALRDIAKKLTGIMSRHEGDVFARAKEILDRKARENSQKDGENKQGSSLGRDIRKILVVDDEESKRLPLEQLLSSQGYEVVTAVNGKEALDIIDRPENLEKPFDLVTVDFDMPVMNGYEFAIGFRKQERGDKRTIIVMITGREPSDKWIARLLDANVLDRAEVKGAVGVSGLMEKLKTMEIKPVVEEKLAALPVYTPEEAKDARAGETFVIFEGPFRHDINNLLGVVVGFSELLLDEKNFIMKYPRMGTVRIFIDRLSELVKASSGLVKEVTDRSKATAEIEKAIALYRRFLPVLHALKSACEDTLKKLKESDKEYGKDLKKIVEGCGLSEKGRPADEKHTTAIVGINKFISRAEQRLASWKKAGEGSSLGGEAVVSRQSSVVSGQFVTEDGIPALLASLSLRRSGPAGRRNTDVSGRSLGASKEIRKQFGDDSVLLRRIEAIFTQEDMTALLAIRAEMDKFYKEGKIKFAPALKDHSKFILDRMAFELTLLYPVTPLQPFTIEWTAGEDQLSDAFLRYRGKFEYEGGINRKFVPKLGNHDLLEFDRSISAECHHFAQFYFQNIRGFTVGGDFTGEVSCGFREATEHLLHNSLYPLVQGVTDDLCTSVYISSIQRLLLPKVPKLGFRWGGKIVEKLSDWIEEGVIQIKELPKYARAYAQLFASIDSAQMLRPGDTELEKLGTFAQIELNLCRRFGNSAFLYSISMHFEDDGINKLLDSNKAELLRSLGIDVSGLKQWIKEHGRLVLALEKSDTDVKQPLKKLKGLLAATLRTYSDAKLYLEKRADEMVDNILAIDSPEALLKQASRAIEPPALRSQERKHLDGLSSEAKDGSTLTKEEGGSLDISEEERERLIAVASALYDLQRPLHGEKFGDEWHGDENINAVYARREIMDLTMAEFELVNNTGFDLVPPRAPGAFLFVSKVEKTPPDVFVVIVREPQSGKVVYDVETHHEIEYYIKHLSEKWGIGYKSLYWFLKRKGWHKRLGLTPSTVTETESEEPAPPVTVTLAKFHLSPAEERELLGWSDDEEDFEIYDEETARQTNRRNTDVSGANGNGASLGGGVDDARPEDAVAISNLFIKYFSAALGGSRLSGNYWEGIIAKCFVKVWRDKESGVVGFIYAQDKDNHKKKKHAHIEYILVDSSSQRKGIATKLVKSLLHDLNLKGYRYFTIAVTDNTGAIRKIIDKKGFKPLPDKPDEYFLEISGASLGEKDRDPSLLHPSLPVGRQGFGGQAPVSRDSEKKVNSVSLTIKPEIQIHTDAINYLVLADAQYLHKHGFEVSFKTPYRGVLVLGNNLDTHTKLISISRGAEITISVSGPYGENILREVAGLISRIFEGRYYWYETEKDKQNGENGYLKSKQFDKWFRKIIDKHGIDKPAQESLRPSIGGASLGKKDRDPSLVPRDSEKDEANTEKRMNSVSLPIKSGISMHANTFLALQVVEEVARDYGITVYVKRAELPKFYIFDTPIFLVSFGSEIKLIIEGPYESKVLSAIAPFFESFFKGEFQSYNYVGMKDRKTGYGRMEPDKIKQMFGDFLENRGFRKVENRSLENSGASLGEKAVTRDPCLVSRDLLDVIRENVAFAKTKREIMIDGRSLGQIDPREFALLCKNRAIGLRIIWAPEQGAGFDRKAYLERLGLYQVCLENNRWDAMNLNAAGDRFSKCTDDSKRFEIAIDFYGRGLDDIRHAVLITASHAVPRKSRFSFQPYGSVLKIDENTKHALLLAEYLAEINGNLAQDELGAFGIKGNQFVPNLTQALCLQLDAILSGRKLTGKAA
ncbi:MAG: GNAT family N-acetyltransferase [Candidatus Omnitrophica bacterium]|nr:GNAT family N-acetyltransferase [Candidatus Omnitrophota bacterium]